MVNYYFKAFATYCFIKNELFIISFSQLSHQEDSIGHMRAIQAVKDDHMPISTAAKCYGVPRSSLQDRILGKVDLDTVKSGPDPLFSQEQEALLCNHIKTMAEVGYGYSRQETMNLASEFAVQLGLRQEGTLLTDKWFLRLSKQMTRA